MDWIDVNDRLPDHHSEYVIVCMSSGLAVSTLYCVDKNYFNHSCGTELLGDLDGVSMHFEHARKYGYKVTYWMPLPKPPQKTYKKKSIWTAIREKVNKFI